jgi:nucleoside-diphosphate-sugar epimerase
MWLLETFAHANVTLGLQARAVILTRNPAAIAAKAPHLAARPELEFIAGDVRDFAFPDGTFSHVIHAGTTSSAPVEPQEMFDTIVDGTRRVLEFAATHGTRKLLFVSSGAVYGRQPPELTRVSEDYRGAPDPLEPNSAYGEGKRAAEWLCNALGTRYGFETKIARCFAFVGPHLPLDAHFAIGNFIRDAMRGGPIRVGGDGTPYRSYLYAADLAVWLWTLLFRGGSRRAYNLGSEAAMPIAELAKQVAQSVSLSISVTIAKAVVPDRVAERYVPSTQRAQTDLGLHEVIPLFEAIRRTISWHQAQLARSSGVQS